MTDIWHDSIQSLQVDISSYCNAKCGGCARNRYGNELSDGMKLVHFDTEMWHRLVTKDLDDVHVKELVLNGNWGDPMMHPDLVEMLALFAEHHPETSLYIHTNGSMRTTKFWAGLAKSCRQFANHLVIFAIDGLEDTHSIYRRNTDFGKLTRNIAAFTEAQGRANVTMTLFKHNEHQVNEVRDLAVELNATYFTLRNSHGDDLLIETDGDPYKIYASDAVSEEQTELNADFKLSDNPDYMKYLDISDAIEDADSECPWLADRMIQIDPWGTVWPCCHISYHGSDVFLEYTGEEATDEHFSEARTDNNLRMNSLYAILQNNWYTNVLPEAVDKEKWIVCKEQCFS